MALSQAQQKYLDYMLKTPGQASSVESATQHVRGLNDAQALSSLNANKAPSEMAGLNTQSGFSVAGQLAQKYGVSGNVSMGQGVSIQSPYSGTSPQPAQTSQPGSSAASPTQSAPMATTVPNNPYDTQQPKAANTGIVGSTMTAPKTSGYFSRNADVAAEFAKNNLGLTEQQFADVHYSKFGAGEGRSASSPAMTSSGNTTTNTSTAQSPTPPHPPAATPATYTPTQRTVDRPTETAQGQMESILSKDSPLMERARTLARQGMAQRGLVNSSMAQGAGVAAMIDRATPIAQQDAQTFSQASSENMGAKNTAGQFNAGEINKFGLQTSQQVFQAAQSQLDRDQQVSITRLSNDLNNANVSKTFAANLALSTSNQVAAIAADPNLNPDSKRVAIQNAVDNANSTMQWGSTFYNTPLPTIAGPGGTASTVESGGTYKPSASSTAAATIAPTDFWSKWATAHDATGDFSTLAPYVRGKTIEQVMKDTGANRTDAIYILQKVGA